MIKKNTKIESISEEFWPIIDYNYEQIRFAEIKASVIISFYSLLLTVGYTLNIFDSENFYNISVNSIEDSIKYFFLIPAIIFSVISLRRCVQCYLPRLNFTTEKSPFFFGDYPVHYRDFNSFEKTINKIIDNEPEYRRHLSQIVFATGHIAAKKFFFVNKGIISLIRSIAFIILFGVFSYF